MNRFDQDTGLHLAVRDPDLHRRADILHDRGLDTGAIPELDDLARDLAHAAGVPYAMVNFITDRQHFAGLYTAPGARPVARTMELSEGYCPDVMNRPVALILPDVCAHPRFQSNPVVDSLGVRTYCGAPLIHHAGDSTITLGTVCFIGPEPLPQDTGQPNRQLINQARNRAMEIITSLPAQPR